MFRKILVAIDVTDQRHAVLDQAAAIAIRFNAELYLVSVRDFAQHWEVTMADPIPDVFATLERESSNILEEARQRTVNSGIMPQCYTLDGAAIEQIALLAGRINADLIVIGHRHLTRIRRLLGSSVAKGMLERAPCSLLIVI